MIRLPATPGLLARWLALFAPRAAAPLDNATVGGPLTLADEGIFFVGGQRAHTDFPGASPATGAAPPGDIMVRQMYVHYRIPAARKGAAVVMVHGSGHTGATWETTPDGREGWATWFVRQGHPVYVVDHAGRGRSGFDPTPINAVRDGGADPAALPTIFLGPVERAWANFRFGAEYPKPFPGVQFPLEALDQYLCQLVPNTETTLAGGGANSVSALAALLDRIGPAVVMVHSQSGVYGLEVARRRPRLVRALVSIEGGCETVTPADTETPFVNVPLLSVWGDNSEGAEGANGDARRNGCIRAVGLIRGGGGRADFLLLPETGIRGNSHMLMMDRNNREIAGLVRQWIERTAAPQR